MRNDLARKEAYSLKTCDSYRCKTETKTQSMGYLKKRSPFLISLALLANEIPITVLLELD